MAAETEAIARWLGQREAYPHAVDRIEHIETHISHVFLAGDYAYKLKKPVRYDFLDFTTREAREQACREELRLNRRLMPDAYLDVIPVASDARGNYRLDGPGQIVDWLVQMRRLPTEQTLDVLFRRGELRPKHIDRLATTLVRFYRSLAPLKITPQEYRERCAAHVWGNREELMAVGHHLPRGVVERVHGFQLQLLRLRPELFDERVAAGRIIDGHGDLRPEHICLSDEIAIFDCLEFNADFRRIDVADELSFLATECDFLGADWVGLRLIEAYLDQSGDRLAVELLDYYKSYRACVRAKVAALRADQLQGELQQAAISEAHRHLALADAYIQPWLAPLVIVVGGAAGTGKSSLATALCEAIGAELLRTDSIRKELYGSSKAPTEIDGGIYRPEARKRVYDELFQRATALHNDCISVVLDGTFSSAELVRKAQHIATHPRSKFLAVECVCRPETSEERIRRRRAEGGDASEAQPELNEIQRRRWEHWPGEIPQLRVDTEQPLESQVEGAIAALRRLLAG